MRSKVINPMLFCFLLISTWQIALSNEGYIKYAKLLQIEKRDKTFLVRIKSSFESKAWNSYTLTAGSKRIVALSATHVASLDEIDALDSLVGVESIRYISNEKVKKLYSEKKIVEVGYPINVEKIVRIKPDVVFTYDVSGENQISIARLNNQIIMTIPLTEYLESTPLGRAEWIKLIGIVTGKEREAFAAFEKIEKKYLELSLMVKKSSELPRIVGVGDGSGDYWTAPSADSNFVQIIRDAGGSYLWSENSFNRPISVSKESAFVKMKSVDFWLVNNRWNSLDELIADDKRYETILTAIGDNVYNNNLDGDNESGGYNFWERAFVRPDILLEELIAIFHPKLIKHKFVWYHKLLLNSVSVKTGAR